MTARETSAATTGRMATAYLARHATHMQMECDKLACAARDLISGLEDVRGFRTCDPRPSDVSRFNSQQIEIASLIHAYIAAVHKEADDHGLEDDLNGALISCDGFDQRAWRLPEAE